MNETTGVIQSLGYPDYKYANGLDCVWIIDQSGYDFDFVIRLEFGELDIYKTPSGTNGDSTNGVSALDTRYGGFSYGIDQPMLKNHRARMRFPICSDDYLLVDFMKSQNFFFYINFFCFRFVMETMSKVWSWADTVI